MTQMNGKIIALTSPAGLPFDFFVAITDKGGDNDQERLIAVTGNHVVTKQRKTNEYILHATGHNSYLNFFEQLSSDFGLRLPQNRKEEKKSSFMIPYKEVLSSNIAPGILYGYGDPAAILVNEGVKEDRWYYIVSTSNDAPDSFPIIKSKDLKQWSFVNYVFPQGKKPAWAADGELTSDYWAPEIHYVRNEYRVYFVARDKVTLELCIGMARSPHPEGPYHADPEPILRGNKIDPHIFMEDDNTAYLLWKEDNNESWPSLLNNMLYQHPGFIDVLFEKEEDRVTTSFILTIWPWAEKLPPMERFLVIQVQIEAVIAMFADFYHRLESLANTVTVDIQEKIRPVLNFMRTPVYAQPLSEDGSSLIGQRTKLIENDLAWEAHLVEGVWLTKQESKYYLFYAGNDFSTDKYGIGVAISDSPTGPFEKLPSPFLQSTENWWAPGHPSLVKGPDGVPLMFLHAFFPKETGYKQFRALLSVSIKFSGNSVLFV
jgi:hypothetical protein